MRSVLRFLTRSLATSLLAMLVLGLTLQVPFYARASDETLATVQNADSSVGQAFAAVLDAQKAGGNVSGLLVELGQAGELLADAQMAYRNGNSDEATSKAENAISLAESVKGEAVNLKTTASAAARNTFLLSLAFLLVGAPVFILGLYLYWRRFRRAYEKKLFGMKPEVAS